MAKYNVTHTTKFTYSEPVPVCHNLVHLAPRPMEHQTCREFSLLLSPAPPYRHKRLDYFGNQVDYFSIHVAHQGLTVTAHSHVEVLPAPARPAGIAGLVGIGKAVRQDVSREGLAILPIHISLAARALVASIRRVRAGPHSPRVDRC